MKLNSLLNKYKWNYAVKEITYSKKLEDHLLNVDYDSYYFFNIESCSAIDQKCTFDLLAFVCNLILEKSKEYKNIDDFYFNYATFIKWDYFTKIMIEKNNEYGKATNEEKNNTIKEYDKFFKQQFEMLSYIKVLQKVKKTDKSHKCRFQYKIINIEILEELKNEDNSLFFLCYHALNLVQSDELFELLHEHKNSKIAFKDLNKRIKQIIIDKLFKLCNGKRKKDLKQISLKLIHPIFYYLYLKKFHSNKNNAYSFETKNNLKYFRQHVRDKNKPFDIPRNVYEKNNEINVFDKNKNDVKNWSKQFNNIQKYISDYSKELIQGVVHVHHIIPKSCKEYMQFKNIDLNMHENLVILSVDEHYNIAHKNSNLINKEFLKKILWIQYSKILDYNQRKIGNFSLINFYYLINSIFCENKKINNFSNNLETIKNEIEFILDNYCS